MTDVVHWLAVLCVAGLLGGALGLVRPIGRNLVPRPSRVVRATVLLAVLGAVAVMVVGNSLPRALAGAVAAGLIRHRTQIDDLHDAVVTVVAVAIGLAAGAGMLLFATTACAFVIAVLWSLESLEPSALCRFELRIAARHSLELQPLVERLFRRTSVPYELWGSSPDELRYEVIVPSQRRIRTLSKLIGALDTGYTFVDFRLKHSQIA